MEEMTKTGQFLDFETAKVQTLSLADLERTHKENDIYGKPLRGIYHHDLIREIKARAEANNYKVEIYDLFAAQNKERNCPGVSLLPQIEAIHGEHAVEAHILRRVYANIRLTNMDDEETTTNLAVAFHQKGIQVGFGPMVKICHNQCMLSPEHYATTYGKGDGLGLTIPQILEKVENWFANAQSIIGKQREKMEKMKSIEIEASRTFQLIGMLTAIRVACDTQNKDIRRAGTYPLNQAQIGQLTEDMLVAYNKSGKVTLWDFYNSATEMFKANRMDIPQMLPQNREFVKFMDEQFALA